MCWYIGPLKASYILKHNKASQEFIPRHLMHCVGREQTLPWPKWKHICKCIYVLGTDIGLLWMQLHVCVCGITKTLRSRQNGRHFADDIFKCIFVNENVWIPIEISLKFVPTGPINNIPALVQIMAWRRAGDKPLSEPMMVSLPTHICVSRPQWVECHE